MDILDTIEGLDEESELDELELEENEDEVDPEEELELITEEDLPHEMSEGKAREVTDAIRAAASATYVLLDQAHKGKAHKALGYATWAEYVQVEFDISASRSYQLLDLSKVIRIIDDVTPEGTKVKLTEAEARDIKRELPKITERIREETEGLDPSDASSMVNSIIDEAREQKKRDQEAIDAKEKNLAEAAEEGRRRGLEEAADALLEAEAAGTMGSNADGDFVEVQVSGDDIESMSPQLKMDLYNFFNVLESIGSLPEPDDFIKSIPPQKAQEITNQINVVTSWVNRFSALWEVQED